MVEDIGLTNQFGKEANRSAPVFAFYLKISGVGGKISTSI
jgi:hypothetical protein